MELQVMRWATACSVFTFWALLSNCYVVFLLVKEGVAINDSSHLQGFLTGSFHLSFLVDGLLQ